MDGHGEAKLKAEEIARRGREIYERDIRSEEFDRDHDGDFLVIDVTTGDYAVGEDDDEAFDRMEGKNPEGLFYLTRVGRRAAHRIGGAGARLPRRGPETGRQLDEFLERLERRRRDDGVELLSEDETTNLATEELHAMRRERRVAP